MIALVFIGIYLFTKKDNNKLNATNAIGTSIFNNRPILPYGIYYISNGKNDASEAINSVVTVSNTKLVLETKYKNDEYQKREFTFPLTPDENTLKTDSSGYKFLNIDMGSYIIDIHIKYYETKLNIEMTYYKKGSGTEESPFISYDNRLESLNQNQIPSGFKLPYK